MRSFLYRPRTDDVARFDRLYAAIERCTVGMELAKRVYHLGRPAFTSNATECPTSCVRLRPGGGVIFQFNREFFDSLGGDEIAFVTLHEALHIAFRHAERRGKRDPMVWNVACDVVINELLLLQPPFDTIKTTEFERLIEGAATYNQFKRLLLHAGPATALSADMIYDRLTRHPQMRRWVARVARKLRPFHFDEFLDGPLTIAGAAGWQRELLGRRLDKLLAGSKTNGFSAVECGEIRQVQRITAPKMRWDALLMSSISSLLDDDRVETWQPSRRMAMFYPEILLPSERDDLKRGRIKVLVAIDASGSIERAQLDELIALVRSIPRDRVELATISFDVKAYPFDLDCESSQPRGGGGTSFVCIEDFAATMPSYPDLVVVVTDGAGTVPKPQYPSRWIWVLTPEATDLYVNTIGTTVCM